VRTCVDVPSFYCDVTLFSCLCFVDSQLPEVEDTLGMISATACVYISLVLPVLLIFNMLQCFHF